MKTSIRRLLIALFFAVGCSGDDSAPTKTIWLESRSNSTMRFWF